MYFSTLYKFLLFYSHYENLIMQLTAFKLNYENKEVPNNFAYHQATVRLTND
jgi:hypothetical protein